jgi:DNA polymerase-3 subunit beta
LAAADGFRLAVHKTEVLDAVPEKLSVIVPARTLQEVERLIEGDEPIDIVVTPQKSQVLFRLQNVEIVSQLIQGTFPNYSQLVPQEHTTRAIVDLGELQRATRTASIFAKDGSGIIRIQMAPGANGGGTVTISSRAEELGDNTGEIEASVEGEEGKIAFNSRYLSDVLAVLGKDKVAMEMTTSSSPGVIKPVDSDNYIHVVMPMFVQW